jgi:hypothetical protein
VGSRNAHGCAQNTENGLGFQFLERQHEDGDEFISQIVRVTIDETWDSFVKVKNKEQSKQGMHTHSPSKPKNCKEISVREIADGNCFLGEQMSADG